MGIVEEKLSCELPLPKKHLTEKYHLKKITYTINSDEIR
jgi:hypothetical protein